MRNKIIWPVFILFSIILTIVAYTKINRDYNSVNLDDVSRMPLADVGGGDWELICISYAHVYLDSEIERFGFSECWRDSEVPKGKLFVSTLKDDKTCGRFVVHEGSNDSQIGETKCFKRAEALHVYFVKNSDGVDLEVGND